MNNTTTIVFKNMKGSLATEKDKNFLRVLGKINTDDYDYIYSLDDGWAGSYLLIKNNNYRLLKCGSGLPIIGDTTGTFVVKKSTC